MCRETSPVSPFIGSHHTFIIVLVNTILEYFILHAFSDLRPLLNDCVIQSYLSSFCHYAVKSVHKA